MNSGRMMRGRIGGVRLSAARGRDLSSGLVCAFILGQPAEHLHSASPCQTPTSSPRPGHHGHVFGWTLFLFMVLGLFFDTEWESAPLAPSTHSSASAPSPAADHWTVEELLLARDANSAQFFRILAGRSLEVTGTVVGISGSALTLGIEGRTGPHARIVCEMSDSHRNSGIAVGRVITVRGVVEKGRRGGVRMKSVLPITTAEDDL